MNKPVKTLRLAPAQINVAVQTYLNEHVFREPIEVERVEIAQTYDGSTGEAVITLVSTDHVSDGPTS